MEVMQARFLKPAEAEVDEAIAHFREQRDGLGDRTEQDLIATVHFICEYPFTGKPISEAVRKFSSQHIFATT
jgi:hypothetical protein